MGTEIFAGEGALAAGGDAHISSSWERCRHQFLLERTQPPQLPVLTGPVLSVRLARHADIIECARHEMASLFQQFGDDESAVALSDTEGVIIHLVSSQRFALRAEPLGLQLGAIWSEEQAGTNGMGTCLAERRPISVRQEDHYFNEFGSLTCSAVPIYGPSGDIAAVLNVSSHSPLMQQHMLVLLGMTARMIENRLIDHRYGHAALLHFHSRAEFVHTLHEGKLAIGDDGGILAANRSALFQLGMQSANAVRVLRVEDLFQTTLAEMHQRSEASSYHPVVIFRTTASSRFFAVARRPAGGSDQKGGRRPSHDAGEGPAAHVAARSTPRGSLSVFKDSRLIQSLELARRVVGRGTPLLLRGETGSGKEVFAKAVHEHSPNATGTFVAVNCASLPEHLIEAELFGYRAGAFTGAQRTGRRGKILQSHQGTLFLDEIADMPLDLQARLLRVLDERAVTPLGTEETQAVDFQLISASHGHLPDLVREGRFREDLFYRLSGIEITLPALRERSDLRDLVHQLLAVESGGDGKLSPAAERLLLVHPWPGNVRQLRHVLRSASALADGHVIEPAHLPSLVASTDVRRLDNVPASLSIDDAAGRLNPLQLSERAALIALLAELRWNVSAVAKSLQISRNTLYRKFRRLQIPVDGAESGSSTLV